MSSICGIINYGRNCLTEDFLKLTYANGITFERRFMFSHTNRHNVYIGLSCNRRDYSPPTVIYKNVRYTFVFDGIIYNSAELVKSIASELGFVPVNEENYGAIAAWSYILWGGFSPQRLNGKFAYVIYSESIFENDAYSPKIFMARDRLGIKPLYFSYVNNEKIIFSSSIKGILSQREITPRLDKFGLWQILFLSGGTVENKTLFENIYELQAGFCAYIDCRADASCNIMQKRYHIFKSPKLCQNIICSSDIKTCEQVFIEDCFPDRDITVDDLEKSVEITEAPYFASNLVKIKSAENGAPMLSRIGCDAFTFNDDGYIKSFFPWIADPYKSIEFFKKDVVNALEGFNWLSEIFESSKRAFTFDEDERASRNRIKMCMYYLYNTPCKLKYNEKIADHYSLPIKYAFADNDIFEYYYNNLSSLERGVDKCNCGSKIKTNSEFDRSIKQKLNEIVSNSEYKINLLIDKDRVRSLLCSEEDEETLRLLFLVHTWLEKFNIEPVIKE